MTFSENLIQDLMRTVRGKSQVTKLDVTDLAEACVVDLSLVGVYVTDPEEPLCKQALNFIARGIMDMTKIKQHSGRHMPP